MVYETLKRHILEGRKASEMSPLTFFAVGATAKAIATFITYPLQLVQTKMRVSFTIPCVLYPIEINWNGPFSMYYLFQHGHNYPGLKADAGSLELTAYILR